MTQSARTPVASASRAASSTEAPGTQITARSTVAGKSRRPCVAGDAADRLAAAVDGVDRAGEIGLEHVAEQLAADRPAAWRGADHGDRTRLEERA